MDRGWIGMQGRRIVICNEDDERVSSVIGVSKRAWSIVADVGELGGRSVVVQEVRFWMGCGCRGVMV